MNKSFYFFLVGIFFTLSAVAQQTLIRGSVKNADSFEPIPGVAVTIEETQQSTQTDDAGEFEFSLNVPLGEQVLRISKDGYLSKRYPIVVNEGQRVNITDMTLEVDISEGLDLFTISLSDSAHDHCGTLRHCRLRVL